MKNVFRFLTLVGMTLAMASCVQDLNTTPIDKNSATGFNQDALFTKIYATLGTTGQTGAAGAGDIDDIDEGWSGLFRVTWVLNGFPTEDGWWIWNDVGVAEMRDMSWDGENALIKCLYFRCMIDAKYCNHFLEYADQSDDKGKQQCAEVRFIRALNYWYLLDMFKFVPYMAKESVDPENYPDFYSRTQMFNWLETELKDLTVALPDKRLNKYRVDKTAAYLLLARLYLNAEVYTGTARWEDAKTYADLAISHGTANGYKLHSGEKTAKDGTRFSAYQQLFMGDNDINGAQDEAVLLIYQDGKYCRSYGGAQYAIAATRDGGMVPWGVSANWKCFRSSPELIYKFVEKEAAAKTKFNEYEMPVQVKDDRAIFCSKVKGNTNNWSLSGNKAADFYASWACPKFTAVYSSVDSIKKSINSDSEWPDTDIPLIRLAEAYMTKAEAMYRLGDAGGAMKVINDNIRERAHAAKLTSLSDQVLCDEWLREFWGEGRRRIDLIRFNRFAGSVADGSGYTWEGRPGVTKEFRNWYPVPSDDKRTNPNFLKQVVNNSENPYAAEGGDGYTYAK